VEFPINPEEASEELRLWADYYEATARVLEIMRTQGTTAGAVAQIVAEEAKAAGVLQLPCPVAKPLQTLR
jgi:predicted secreted protein